MDDPNGRRQWIRAAAAFSLPFLLAAGLLLGYGAGTWLDRRLGTDPWLTVAGVVLGAVAAFRALLRQWFGGP